MDIGNQQFSNSIYYNCNQRRSNLPFQIALYINLWLFPIWLSITIVSLDTKFHSLTTIYKLVTIAVVAVLSISESFKLYLGYAGNLTGKIPKMAYCWLIMIFIELPLEIFVLFDRSISFHYTEIIVNAIMTCLLLIEIITGIIALLYLADQSAKTFYLMRLYNTNASS